MIEQCGCAESPMWEKLAKKLAGIIKRKATVNYYGIEIHKAEGIVYLAAEILKTKTEVGE